jgi:hypothetical protein
MPSFDAELDARGLNCPLPILRAKKSIQALNAGQVLRIVATASTGSIYARADRRTGFPASFHRGKPLCVSGSNAVLTGGF